MLANTVESRLRPLYVSTFFGSFVFWTAVEKIFMKNIGFDDASIGLALSIMFGVSLLVEVPSGILSDKWSRKGTLQLALGALLIASFGSGISNSVPVYIFFASFLGVWFALESGTKQSIIYDVVLEEDGDGNRYQKFYGRHEVVTGVALVAGALGSSVIMLTFNSERATFFLTLPMTLIAMLALNSFEEPKLHKVGQVPSLLNHIKQTFREVLRQPHLYTLLATMMLVGVIINLIFGYSQLWWISLGLALPLFGVLNAFIESPVWVAGLLAQRLNNKSSVFAAVIASFGFTVAYDTHSFDCYRVAQFVLLSVMFTLGIFLSKRLNDNLSSQIRAGAGSIVGLMVKAISIVFVFTFGYLSERFTIFSASWLIFALTILVVIGITVTVKTDQP